MQKKLIAVAVLGACVAGSAFAANVDVYGRIDTGLSYVHEKIGDKAATDKLSMDSGLSSGSRWGLKGSEDLGNGYQVGFVLESGFSSDTGAIGEEGKLFNREATLRVSGPFGSIYAGRMGRIGSDAGSVGFYAGSVSPFGSGWGKMAGPLPLRPTTIPATATPWPMFPRRLVRSRFTLSTPWVMLLKTNLAMIVSSLSALRLTSVPSRCSVWLNT